MTRGGRLPVLCGLLAAQHSTTATGLRTNLQSQLTALAHVPDHTSQVVPDPCVRVWVIQVFGKPLETAVPLHNATPGCMVDNVLFHLAADPSTRCCVHAVHPILDNSLARRVTALCVPAHLLAVNGPLCFLQHVLQGTIRGPWEGGVGGRGCLPGACSARWYMGHEEQCCTLRGSSRDLLCWECDSSSRQERLSCTTHSAQQQQSCHSLVGSGLAPSGGVLGGQQVQGGAHDAAALAVQVHACAQVQSPALTSSRGTLSNSESV